MGEQLPAEHGTRRHGRVVAWLVTVNLCIIVLLALLATMSLLASHDVFKERARLVTENLADSLQKAIGAELNRVDLVLRMAAQHLEVSGTADRLRGAEVHDMLKQQESLLGFVDSLRVADANGFVRAGRGVDAERPVNLSDRDAFQLLRDRPEVERAITGPVMARISKQWVIGVARRIRTADGRFAGIVYANVPVAHFQRMLSDLRLGEQGAVTLRSSSMQLIARSASGADPQAGTGDTTISEALQEAVRADPHKGSFVAPSAMDLIERRTSYQQVGDYPLLVLVGVGTHEFMGPWRVQLAEVVGLVLTLAAVVFVASRLLYDAWRRESDSAQERVVEARRHQALLRTASDGIHVLDRQGRVVELSDSFAAMLQRPRDQVQGMHVGEWDATFSQESITQWLQTLAIGENYKTTTLHKRADGTLVDVEINCVGVNIDGRDLIYCSARDITERNRMQEQLLGSANALRDLYDRAPCGYHSLGPDGRFLHINETELGWLECTRDEVIGRCGIADFFTAEGKAQFERSFPLALAGQGVSGLEFDLVSKTGRVRRVSISASAVMDGAGAFAMTRSVIYDITELQQARERLQLALREQQAMLDNDLIGIVKSKGQLTVWKNQAMDRIFGFDPEALLGQSARMLFPDEESYGAMVKEAYPIMLSGGHYRRQHQLLRKDGQAIWIDANGVLISAANQEFLWLLADITPIRESQARIEHMAFHDHLTGLPNRPLLEDRFVQAVAWAQRHAHKLAVCYLDLDGFKRVNDRFGHPAGDELLREIARRLQASVRANDTVCRLGGDEFVLLLNEADDHEECLGVLERARAEVAKPVAVGAEHTAGVTASIGVAVFPAHGVTLDALLNCSDQALYQAKEGGRNKVCVFHAPTHGAERSASMRLPPADHDPEAANASPA